MGNALFSPTDGIMHLPSSAANACPLQSCLSPALNNPPIHVNSDRIGSALFSPAHHAPHVGRPFQSSNSTLLRIKEDTPEAIQNLPPPTLARCSLFSLSCFQQPPIPRELPPHGERPLQFGSLAGPQQMTCTLFSLLPSTTPNSRELPLYRECPLQSDSNAKRSRNYNLFSFHGLLSPS